jgi:hypothetical protein
MVWYGMVWYGMVCITITNIFSTFRLRDLLDVVGVFLYRLSRLLCRLCLLNIKEATDA